MADIAIAAANVRGAASKSLVAAVALTAGQFLYKDSNGKADLASSAAAATSSVTGVALDAAGADQPVMVQSSGQLTIQGGLTAGTFYYLSATPGNICPFADLVATNRVVQVGYAISATVLQMSFLDTGITL